MKKLIVLMLVVLALVSTYSSVANADGYPFYGTLGAQMFATGSTISATVGVCYAGYNSTIEFFTWNGSNLTSLGVLGMSQATGTPGSWAVTPGAEIVIGINANNSGTWFYSGSGSASYQVNDVPNAHARVDFVGLLTNPTYYGGPTLVGFEDLPISSGDGDFNDATIVSVSGVHAVPEASTLIGFGSALVMAGPGMIGWIRRRRS